MYVLCACVVVVAAVAVLVLCKQVVWYKYSYHGAKHLETRKAAGRLIESSS